MPRVLGRFGNFEIRIATRKEVRKAQRLRFKVFYEEGGAWRMAPRHWCGATSAALTNFAIIC